MGPEGGKVLDISILPSIFDQGNTSQGLCGTLNNNTKDDFHDKDGNTLSGTESDFIKHWTVNEADNLFSRYVYEMELENWVYPVCTCKANSVTGAREQVCEQSMSDCTHGTLTGQHSCAEVSNRRSVRSVTKRPRVPRIRLPVSQARRHKVP